MSEHSDFYKKEFAWRPEVIKIPRFYKGDKVMPDIKAKITACSSLLRDIEDLEFRMIDLGMSSERQTSRALKRAIICRQTELWNQMDEPSLEITDLKKVYKKKKKK